MKPSCFLDIDGVLADFWFAACHVHNHGYHQTIEQAQRTGVDIIKCMGLTHEQFWAPLGQEFWANLPVLPDALGITAMLEYQFNGRVALLTSPPRNPEAVIGKLQWIAKHFPTFTRRVVITPVKYLCAHPGALLVDDWEKQCDEFRDSHGQALMLPRPWNSGYRVQNALTWLADSVDCTMPYLRDPGYRR